MRGLRFREPSRHMLRPVKLAVFAMIVAALATGCGRYEGPPEPAFESTLDIEWDDDPLDREGFEHPDARTLRVIVRDVDQNDVYDEDQDCRLSAPPDASRDWFEKFASRLVISANETESGSNSRVLELPVQAQKVTDGCEAPGMLVTLPFSEEYTAHVIDPMCCGVFNPEKPFYPSTFDVPWMGASVPTPTLIVFK